ncbi:PepSY-associated TM helix domain-containing protein [Flavivirga aquimarina]|uniref:PepSY-associated TM helix domain-containing protein n=1 Tax=Flavivirga aquimarina TaxID=2027862 RepID=A0ABT8WD52_9FLAO|nr:PepSY-associated TM helix domain-containing protein [Flavivirga aquimarina]MDO5971058.1 PepSY-associated TM helix domain-containing protein [Flavivirga aquimarina]
MKKKAKNYIRKVHLWFGMISGVIVFIIALTGAIYVFSEDIKHVIYKDRRNIEIPLNTKKLPISKLLKVAEGAFDNEYSFQNIVIPNFPDKTISFIFQKTDENKFWYKNYMEFNKTVYINPYTGEIVKIENTKWEFFNVVFWIHMTLFLGYNTVSSAIIEISMWIFVFMLISGLILWWPKKNQRKISFSFKWKTNTRWKRKNYDLHKILGFYVLLLALISALTGLMWASGSFNKTVKWVANGGKTIARTEIPKPKIHESSLSLLDDILTNTLAEIPESKYILIRKHPKNDIPYIVRSYVSETINYKRIEMYYDRNSAELLSKHYFSDKNNGDKIQALNYDIHVGTIGGWPTKILNFLMSLIVASLPITGFLIWRGRHKKHKNVNNLL